MSRKSLPILAFALTTLFVVGGHFVVIPVVGGLALQPATAQAGTILDTATDSSYTALAQQPAYAPVGMLTYTQSGGNYFASGTLISSRWVLTAGHVVSDGTNLSTNTVFTLGGNALTTSQVVKNPSYTGNVATGFDLGLVKLAAPITTVAPATRYTGKLEVGQISTSVGFGDTGNGLTGYADGSGGTKRAGNNTIDALGNAAPLHFSSNILMTDFDDPNAAHNVNTYGSSTPLPLEYSIAPGDSGGGLFINVNGQQVLAGVHSFGYPKTGSTFTAIYGDLNGSTRVSAFTDWVDNTIGDAWAGVGSSLSFAAGSNWGDGVAPGTNDIANFLATGTRTVNFSSAVTNQRLRVRAGTTTLNLAGFNYSLTMDRSVLVGNSSGDTGVLMLNGGGTLTGSEGIVGELSGSTGRVTISGANTLWNTTGNLYVGGSSVGPGGTGAITTMSGGAFAVGGLLEIFANGSVTFSSTVNSTAGSLLLNGSAATITGTGTLTVAGLTTWTTGTMSGAGLTLASGGIAFSGNSNRTLDTRTLTNGGTATWTGNGTITTTNGAVFNNLAGVTFDIQNNASWLDSTITPGVINNDGLLQKSAGTSTTINVPLSNTGTVRVTSGTLNFTGAITQYSAASSALTGGSWYVGPSATLQLPSGDNILSNQANITLDGAGSTFTQISSLSDNQGTFTLAGGRNFGTAGGFTDSGSLIAGAGSLFTVNGALNLNGGTVGGAGNVQATNGFGVSGTATKSGSGTLTVGGTQANAVGSTLNITGGAVNLTSDAGSESAKNLNVSLSGSGTQLNISSTEHLNSLALHAGTKVILAPNSGTLVLNALDFESLGGGSSGLTALSGTAASLSSQIPLISANSLPPDTNYSLLTPESSGASQPAGQVMLLAQALPLSGGSLPTAAVPEPSSLALLMLSSLALGFKCYRRRCRR